VVLATCIRCAVTSSRQAHRELDTAPRGRRQHDVDQSHRPHASHRTISAADRSRRRRL